MLRAVRKTALIFAYVPLVAPAQPTETQRNTGAGTLTAAIAKKTYAHCIELSERTAIAKGVSASFAGSPASIAYGLMNGSPIATPATTITPSAKSIRKLLQHCVTARPRR